MIAEWPISKEEEVVYSPEMDRESVRELGKLKARVKALESGDAPPLPNREWMAEKDTPLPESSLNKTNTILAIIASVIVIIGAMIYVVKSELREALIQPTQDIAGLKKDVEYLRRDFDHLPSLPELIKELLSGAKKASLEGHVSDAERSIAIASALTDSARQRKLQVPAKFFEDSIANIDGVTAVPALDGFRLSLASYRSSLNSADIHSGSITVHPLGGSPVDIPKYAGLIAKTPDVEIMHIQPCTDTTSNTFENLSFTGGIQALDCGNWDGIAFVNMHIRYSGGTVRLHNVIFVNCTFEFSPGPKSDTIITQISQGYVKVG